MKDAAHSRTTVLVLVLIFFFVIFSMSPTFYEWNARSRIHADRFFELVHNFPTDYNLYLSRIREGKEGAWLATEKYTSEPHAPSLSQVLYVTIGRLAHFAHIQTPYVWFAYHVSRIFFAALLLWVIWKVTEWVFILRGGFWQLVTFLLIVTQSTWPKFETVAGVPRLGGWMGWYTQADSMQRTTFMPHVMFAQAMMVFIFWVFSHTVPAQPGISGDRRVGFITKDLPGNWIFLGIVGLILGIIFPPGLLFIYGVLGLVTIAEFFKTWWVRGLGGKGITGAVFKEWFVRSLFARIIFGIVSAPSLVYFSLLLGQYPWKRLAEFDVLHPTKFSYIEYFMAVGPLLPLGILGIAAVLVWERKELGSKLKYFVAWIASWLGFLFIFNQIPQQSPTRFTQMVPQVPLGIFAVYLIWELSRRTWFAGKNSILITHLRKMILLIPVLVILFGLGSMASSYMWLKDFVDHKLRATIPLVPHNAEVMYPMYDIIDAITWLQVYTPRSAIVLSGMTTGNYIPVYSGNTAFIGHANTVQLEIKTAATGNFYNRRLPIEEELAWLKAQKIAYIFYGIEEREISGGVEDLRTLYPALEQVFSNKTVKIYKAP